MNQQGENYLVMGEGSNWRAKWEENVILLCTE